jgi:HlyD family secretion protein
LLVKIDSGSDSPYNRVTSPIDGIVSGVPESVGVRVQPGQPIMTLYDGNGPAATPADFEALVKAASYQAGWEAGELCFAQGGGSPTPLASLLYWDSCNDRLQGSALDVAMRTLTGIVKQTGYAPTPEARNALANFWKALADLRAERLKPR